MLDVYVDRTSNFVRKTDYVLHRMLHGLKRAGLGWRLLERCGSESPASVAFVHVDLTDVPAEFDGITSRYAHAINGGAATVDRRLYSRLRLMSDDAYQGPVIVKTAHNSRGFPELRYESRKSILARAGHVARKLAIPGYKARLCPEYRVYRSLAEVPASAWDDPRLFVERFAPGTLTPPFTRYKYNFCLDVEQNSRATFSSLLYDDGTVESFEVVEEVPDEVRRVRQSLNLDYGAIEYFVVDGDCCVIDANKTMTQPDAWIERFPASGRFIDDITLRLVEFVKSGGP